MSGEPQTMREYVRMHGIRTRYQPESLASIARRAADGDDLMFWVRQFLDDYHCYDEKDYRLSLLVERPQELQDRRHDAFLGALAEHYAAADGLDRPCWSIEPRRFLDHEWFVTRYKGFWARAVIESPAAFRRRGIYINIGTLQRM